MSEMTLEEAWEQFERADHERYSDEHKRCICDSCVALRRILQDCPRSTTVAAGVRILNAGEPETLVALMKCYQAGEFALWDTDGQEEIGAVCSECPIVYAETADKVIRLLAEELRDAQRAREGGDRT